MKKEYMKPTLHIVLLQQRAHLLNSSPFSISSNLVIEDTFGYSGGGTEIAR